MCIGTYTLFALAFLSYGQPPTLTLTLALALAITLALALALALTLTLTLTLTPPRPAPDRTVAVVCGRGCALRQPAGAPG